MELSAFEQRAVEQVKLLKQQIKELQQRDQQREALLEHLSIAVETMQAQLAELYNNRRNIRKMTPPTVEEAEAVFAEKGFPGHGEEFHAHYERQGWRLGNNLYVISWKGCVTTWIKGIKDKERMTAVDRKPAEVRAEAMEQRSREVIEPLKRKRECVEDEAETERLKAEARKIAGVMKRSENEG